MNLLPNRSPAHPFAPHEKLFLELWHSMTHERSLDSHRVRCLNARTVLRELDSEIRSGRLSPEELAELCQEAHEILAGDVLIPQTFACHWRILEPALKKRSQVPDEKKKDAGIEQAFREFQFAVADLSATLERDYFKKLLEALPDALVSGDEARIHAVVGALLSDLVEQGWPLDSLFGWVDLFFQRKPVPYGTFNGNLHFLIRQLAWGKQEFRVILRLSGSKKLAQLGSFEGFEFCPTPNFTPSTGTQEKFAAANPFAAFAETKVSAVDFNAAAIAAREKFEQCLDRMRFNFEPSPLKVDERYFVERGDKRGEMVAVRHLVPNPSHHLTAEAFREFSQGINTVLGRPSIEPQTSERLRAAIRHYRFGRDADSFKDKFLNWWMGLEFLAHVAQGETIGRTVIRHASDTLLQQYLQRLLGDLLQTLQRFKIEWSSDLAGQADCSKLKDLKVLGLVKVLQSQPHAEALSQKFPEHPVAAFRIRRLAAALQSPAQTADMLAAHHRHLVWQLGRLYRIRCCIVHGSSIEFVLPLLTANLEFYLKELIAICLWSLDQNPHVTSLREVFQRATIARQRAEADLRAQNAPADVVRNAVFNSVVIRENP